MKAFVVTAYRWGQRQNHNYLVCVCNTLVEAKEAADKEASYRGGKYGCEVVETSIQGWSEEPSSEVVYYARGITCEEGKEKASDIDRTHELLQYACKKLSNLDSPLTEEEVREILLKL